ncbi:carboxylesterase family protein [Streptomyces sp. NA04227]|uniref:carboxylesterase/lipase family protein n=1 Tax=Streptomyces sp. NA04227 TaxID=2742136 RepID=UPI001592937D|nr:carboxylesterase family protein [Streptomyces sp. NA04227]QKW06829.1 carboxylesterase family protein [Streptomyces sp. NA04227]
MLSHPHQPTNTPDHAPPTPPPPTPPTAHHHTPTPHAHKPLTPVSAPTRSLRTLTRATLRTIPLTTLLLTACSTPGDDSARPPGASAPALTVTTDKGRVTGTEKDGVRRFQGIPYAAPPVADRRWQPPAPAAAWRGVRQATAPGPKCVQGGRNGAPAPGSSEDCLYLNVTAPSETRQDRPQPRPVVVWLHGGSFKTGSGAEYDPARMARDGDVVVVTVNSRLGVFGFYGHPGLDDPGAYGLQDQQAALRWVKANASAFGGDPGQVTLMGESTGGASVCAQLVSPRSEGLFHRAIIQSGACHQNWPKNMLGPAAAPWTYWASRSTVRERGLAAARSLNCPDIACLRGRSTSEVLRLNNRFNQAAYGTRTLPRHPARALADGDFHRVPVLMGTTRDEHRLYAAQFAVDRPISRERYGELLRTSFGPAKAARIARQYPPGDSPGIAWAAVGTDRTWVCPSLESARLMARHVPLHGYEFADRDAPGRDLDPGFPLGAYHASELPYFFDMRGITLDESQAELAARMLRHWTDFAKSGSPGGTWDRFPQTMRLQPGGDAPIDAAAEHHCGFWSSLR